MTRRYISTCVSRLSHENPLSLPRRSSRPIPSSAAPTLPRAQRGLPQKRPIPNINHTIAVSSAKGGVGKSTVAANLALAFARQGKSAGILDCDIFGPSIPTLLGLRGEEARVGDDNKLLPLTSHGIKSMSMGFLVGEGAPVVWRGLMVMKALQQLLHEVAWPPLDILILDLPPGTGDVPLTLTQQVPLTGAVIVSTPQDLALEDSARGVAMFRKVDVPIFGLVRNMGVFKCPGCGTATRIFGGKEGETEEKGGEGEVEAAKKELRALERLGDIPLDGRICEDSDKGMPSVVADMHGRGQVFMDVAEKVWGKIEGAGRP